MPAMAAAEQPESQKPKQEEWIHVRPKSRFRRNAPRPPPKIPGSALSKLADEPRALKSVADITAEYEAFKTRWRDTPCHVELKELVKANAEAHRTVRKAVCLGVGTFDPEDGGWDAKRRSYIQLDGFLTIVEVLSALYKESIPCSFQEPRFTPNDAEFLTNLGHKVVESPTAFEAVDQDTLVFAVHMYRPIYEATLEKASPAMFVGTGWDVWDEFATMKEGDFKCMSDMHDSHKHFPFPQDGTYTTFSSTCLYWRAKTESSTHSKDQSAEDTSKFVSQKPDEKPAEEFSEKVSEDKPESKLEGAPS
ncbi:uncharacterized protein LY79DRAFT_639771 [Colletotrichum navitas]|uniref:SRR1-like domain-containing protein n=1 Tax=Colletotrichum navitas TaxID=681940 RepID=A0AAD8PRK5_9PEZI|nr:uncharacterized protein LY79DRAFT_639771 [Colletotrichum navitas]KAK1574384.1 hypothetical protein LY79DRAFT_639771 [Colletotrichum navitas]